jgi:hypothetical protein
MKLLKMQTRPVSWHLVSLRPNYLPNRLRVASESLPEGDEDCS